MVVIRDYSGVPCPQSGPPLSIRAGDVIELMFADVKSSWWQVRVNTHDSMKKHNMSRLTRLARRTVCRRFESQPTLPRDKGRSAINNINGVTSTVCLPLAIKVYKSLIALWLFITFCVLSAEP